MKKLILLLFILLTVSIFGQSRQRGTLKFRTITELKNSTINHQENDVVVLVSADGETVKQIYTYEPTGVADEIDSFALTNMSGRWVKVGDGNVEPSQITGTNVDLTDPLNPVIDIRNLQETTDVGNNTTNDIVIDPLGSDTNIAGSLLTIKNLTTSTGTNVGGEFIDVKREGASTSSGNTIASVIRTIHNSTGFNDGITGANIIGRYSGSGGANYVYGALINTDYQGSGNVNFLTPLTQEVNVTGTGTGVIDYARGGSPSIVIDNPNATVNYAQGGHPNVTLEQGNIGDSQVIYLDYDFNTANLGNTLNLNGDFAYLQGGGGSDVISAKSHIEAKGNKARFIWNRSDWESDFEGMLNYLGDVSTYTTATNKALVNIEYLNQHLNNVVDETGAWDISNGNPATQTTNGNINYMNGKVGIGTTNPTSKLEVVSSGFASYINGNDWKFSRNNVSYIGSANVGGYFAFITNGRSNSILNSNLSLFADKDSNFYGRLKISESTNGQEPTAALQIDSDDKGFLPPRMTQAEMLAIVNPARGLLVYSETGDANEGLWIYRSTGWLKVKEESLVTKNTTTVVPPTAVPMYSSTDFELNTGAGIRMKDENGIDEWRVTILNGQIKLQKIN